MTEPIEPPESQSMPAVTPEARGDATHCPNWIVNTSVLLRHRRFLARAVGIALLANIAIALLIPRQFQSTARIMPPESSGSGTALLAALAGR